MTQPFMSDDGLSTVAHSIVQDKGIQDGAESVFQAVASDYPAMVHPNFDPKQTPLDPARPLTDIPEPARLVNSQVNRLYGKSKRFVPSNEAVLSKWRLIGSEPLAEHLALLTAAKLIELPSSFYQNYSEQSLLSSLESMRLLDMVDIQRAIKAYPNLGRYGFSPSKSLSHHLSHKSDQSLTRPNASHDPDQLLNSLYAEDWQVILQPQLFETGEGHLATDIMACSVAVHALQQCQTRKSINQSYTAAQICEYLRSYLLSQLALAPSQRSQYRHIRLFTGHIIVAAYHLGWEIEVCDDGACYFNVSSRCGLLTRYLNLNDYYINGWVS